MPRIEQGLFSADRNGPQEACGVTAIFSKKGEIVSPHIAPMIVDLKHRGQDAAGTAVFNKETGTIELYKQTGHPQDVFHPSFHFSDHNLLSDRAIGHNRYATTIGEHKDGNGGVQPVKVEFLDRSLAVAFNGNIPDDLRRVLRARIDPMMKDPPPYDTYDLAYAMVSAHGDNWPERFYNALEGVPLAYSLTMMTGEGNVFGLRSPAGTWPLWVGESEKSILFSSETKVNKSPDVKWRQVKPGELVSATKDGIERIQLFEPLFREFRCSLHDMYTADPDSRITDEATYKDFRKEAGRILAEHFPIEADMYVGVPKTGVNIAEGYVDALGKEHTSFIKRASDLRSYIAKNREETLEIVDGKYIIPNPELVHKRHDPFSVVLIDDSVIKGNTLGGDRSLNKLGVIPKMRAAGAKRIDLLLALSRFVDGCDQGIYMNKDHLVAVVKNETGSYDQLTEEQIALRLGADSVYFMPIDGVKKLYERIFGTNDMACMACMGENHPLAQLAQKEEGHLQEASSLVFSLADD